MTIREVTEIALAVVAALGSGGLIVFGLSSFLGKVWADRLMLKEKATHDRELQDLRVKLERNANADLELIKRQLEVTTTTHLREIADKLAIYRSIIDVVSDVLGEFDQNSRQSAPFPDGLQRRDKFNRQRLKIYGQLAMLAPQSVIDAYDSLSDHLLQIADGNAEYDWTKVRILAIQALNLVRADIGLDKSPIHYRVER